MQKIKSVAELLEAIALLETGRRDERVALLRTAHTAYQAFVQINVVKNIISGAFSSAPMPNNLMKMSLGLGVEFLYNMLLNNESQKAPSSLLVDTLKRGTTNLLANSNLAISGVALALLKKMRYKNHHSS